MDAFYVQIWQHKWVGWFIRKDGNDWSTPGTAIPLPLTWQARSTITVGQEDW